MSLSDGWQLFNLALSGAISGEDSLQERLAESYTYHLQHVSSKDVTEKVWTQLEELKQVVNAKAAVGSEGRILAPTSAMSGEEAAKWLKKIASMSSDVAQAYGVEKYLEESHQAGARE